MKLTLSDVALRGVACALPPNVVELASLEQALGVDDVRRIVRTTGIHSLRVASPGQCASDLCEAAALQLMRSLDVPPHSVDGVVFVSQTPDYRMPATSVLLQHRLGLPNTCVAFDVNYGCSGFVYGLLQSAMLVALGACRRVLLLAGDVMSPYLNAHDKANRMVFADGGSASLVERGAEQWHFQTWTDGSGAPFLIIPAGGARLPISAHTAVSHICRDGQPRALEQLHMHGTKVLSFAAREVPGLLREVATAAGYDLEQAGFIGLHQANRYVVRTIRRLLELPERVVPTDSGAFGNTGPCSIPLLLSSEASVLRQQNELERSILCGFGVGYSAAAVSLSLAKTHFEAPIETTLARAPLVAEARGDDA